MLGDVTASFPPGEVAVVTGPPGSGKSTLLQLLAEVRQPTFGEVAWEGREARPPVAFLPQGGLPASRRDRLLTAAEHVRCALRLRVAGQDRDELRDETALLLEKTGLAAEAGRRCGELSPAQRRRLAVAVALAGSPGILLLDEPEETLDPAAEAAFSRMLRDLARDERIAVVQVTRALDRLEGADTLLVLCGGMLVFHAPPEFLTDYFQIASPAGLFERLGAQKPELWRRSWVKHRSAFSSHPVADARKKRRGDDEDDLPAPPRAALPGWLPQAAAVAGRRWRQARRDGPALALQAALLFGVPFAAAFFATGELAGFHTLAVQLQGDVAGRLRENALFAMDASRGVRLVAGLALAQPLLLAFMAAAVTAREIAGERLGLEIEKRRGLRASAFLAGEVFYLLPWVLLQAAWMGFYVHTVCRLPGNLWLQTGALALTQAAFTGFCLAASALARSASRASTACFCLAALQLPLSGVVLAPPDLFSWAARPLATLPWGGAAFLQSMAGTHFYEAMQIIAPMALTPVWLCALLLSAQMALGVYLAHFGCKIGRLRVACRQSGT